jgi:hypothetical protein
MATAKVALAGLKGSLHDRVNAKIKHELKLDSLHASLRRMS